MKSAIKKVSLFIASAFIFSVFTGCQTTADTSSKPNGDYPAAPTEIMQAELKKTDGTAFKLADYKGKVVLVNLWATWCGPCKAEMPDLVKLQDENKDKGFEVIGLNIDDDEDAATVKSFGEQMGLNYLLAKGEYKLGGDFLKISKVDAIPQSFLIDRDGRLVGVFVGGGKSSIEKIKTNVARVVAG